MGLVMTSTRGFIMPVLGLPVPVADQVKVGFFIEVAVVAGLVLGSIGGIIGIALRQWRRHSRSIS